MHISNIRLCKVSFPHRSTHACFFWRLHVKHACFSVSLQNSQNRKVWFLTEQLWVDSQAAGIFLVALKSSLSTTDTLILEGWSYLHPSSKTWQAIRARISFTDGIWQQIYISLSPPLLRFLPPAYQLQQPITVQEWRSGMITAHTMLFGQKRQCCTTHG